MDKYLNMPVKEVIIRFPGVGKLLEDFGIGCVSCSVGTCALKEVVGIHHVSPEEEAGLMCRIEKEIYPERDVRPPAGQRKRQEAIGGKWKYSPPLQRLVDEHTKIKQWLKLVPVVLEKTDVTAPEGAKAIRRGIDFIRYYADRFHHAKEEDILFGYVGKESDIIKTMLMEHEIGRGFVRGAELALEKKDPEGVAENLRGYVSLLEEHIKKEDDILYPWIDRGLSTTQVGELFAKFNAAEEAMNLAVIEGCLTFVQDMQEKHDKNTEEGRVNKMKGAIL